jgi:predicted dehydrogenase
MAEDVEGLTRDKTRTPGKQPPTTDTVACVVVEKPIAVDQHQLTSLVDAMNRSQGKIFCCFHKRYSDFNRLALEDLGWQPGQPVFYHCIAYHVPMPPLHWYRWPNSKSPLITDGCHWIDHFLHLNGYSEVLVCELTGSSDLSTLNCSITLANGAYFTMVMTYNGSERIGPQDYIELRCNGRTVRIINESEYLAESKQRILRRKRINRMRSYEQMYREICRRISLGIQGDSIASVKGAAAIGLRLQDSLDELIKSNDQVLGQRSRMRG